MIILTGGAGFIGSAYLWKLNSEGIEDIIVVDDLDPQKEKNLQGKKFKDYIDKKEFLSLVLKNKIKKVDTLIHMGACSSTVLTDRDYYLSNNFEYSKEMAKYCLKNSTKFIYASSAATYGAGENGYDDSIENTFQLTPLNYYGESKHLFDLWVINEKLEDKFTGFKFFNVFGPNEYHKKDMMSVVCKNFDKIKETKKIELFKSYKDEYKDGEQKRDFVYIKDVVEVMHYFFQNPQKSGILNLGTGKARSWNDLANAIFNAIDIEPNIEYIEMPESLRPRYQYFTEAKSDKLRKTGCDYSFMELEDSIKDYCRYLESKTYL